MARRRSPDDLSVDELRQLLVEKQRQEHQSRLEDFRKNGRQRAERSAHQRVAPQWRDWDLTLADELDHRKKKKGLGGLLLVVEIAAVLGLLAIIYIGYTSLRDLNQEYVTTLRQPTRTATSLALNVVLPSGHTPPNAQGESQPNLAEVPEAMRPTLQTLASTPEPAPTQGPEQATWIEIPAIGVDAPVVQGDSWEQLKKGVAQHIGTPDPGRPGNLVLSAHNDVFGQLFRDLDHLQAGDQVIISTDQHQYIYKVTGSQIVPPDRVDVMAQTASPTVTLVSCYPFLIDTQRIVVTAELQNNIQ